MYAAAMGQTEELTTTLCLPYSCCVVFTRCRHARPIRAESDRIDWCVMCQFSNFLAVVYFPDLHDTIVTSSSTVASIQAKGYIEYILLMHEACELFPAVCI